jgi:hypothetical protein
MPTDAGTKPRAEARKHRLGADREPIIGGRGCQARVVPEFKTSLKNTRLFRSSNSLGANRRKVGAECDGVGTNRHAVTSVSHRVEQGRDEWDVGSDGMSEKMRSLLRLRGCRNGESQVLPALDRSASMAVEPDGADSLFATLGQGAATKPVACNESAPRILRMPFPSTVWVRRSAHGRFLLPVE